MSCPYINSQSVNVASVKPALRSNPKAGTSIYGYDQIIMWTEEHLTPTQLNEWRKRGDRVVDAFFQRYGEQLQDGEDTYEFIQQLTIENQCVDDDDHSSILHFDRNIRQRPAWFDRERIQRGQHFFLKNSAAALTSIFYYTLLLGYGFQQLNDVFMKTDYLSSEDLALTQRRLVETLQMIATAACGDVDNFDQTFSDVVRVRFLHGMVRYKLVNRYRSLNGDIPINQEDALVTLLGFSFSVLFCIEERMNIRISDEDKQAYLHFWHYIGWLIGIEEECLYYLSSYRLARTISESIFYHLYLPSQTSKHMVHHSLMATYLHGLFPISFQFHIGISQALMGKEFAQVLHIDRVNVNRLHTCAIRLLLKSFQVINWLGALNYWNLNEWIIEDSRQRLCQFVYTGLDNQLCNFALFKNARSSREKVRSVPLKDCHCGYYQKNDDGVIKTEDIGLFRVTQPVFFLPFLQQALLFILLCFSIQYLTGIVM